MKRKLPLPKFEDERRSRDLALVRTLTTKYRFDTSSYITNTLGWTPWSGSEATPGQLEVIQAYELALHQQIERNAWEQGTIATPDLQYWKVGQTIQNELRIEAGHTVGKTKLSSGLVNHFFDCFAPAIIYTFAPSWVQIHDLLWKEIKADRRDKGLPGRILDLRLEIDDNHFATGRATNDNGGKGTEKVQGQHGEYLMFVLDEAEGVPDFVWSAVDSMTGGGICIVLMLANPKTRISKFHKRKAQAQVKSFRISCVSHPNVVQGKEVVPGAVRRQYVEKMMQGDDSFVEVVTEHDPDENTFTLPFSVVLQGTEYPPGSIFKPGGQFSWRVLGVAPKNATVNTFVPPGRYEAAIKREREQAISYNAEPHKLRAGVDVARFGDDFGTVYLRHNGAIWRAAQIWKSDTAVYVATVREQILKAWDDAPQDAKPTDLEIRIDGTGGFGAGVIDGLKNDPQLRAKFKRSEQPEKRDDEDAEQWKTRLGAHDFKVLEVHFGGGAKDGNKYADNVTEMYAEAAETLKGVAVLNAPNALEADLCERTYEYINQAGVSVKKITPKDKFKKDHKRSPDDGDGFVLCAGPDHIFKRALVARVY